MTDIMNNTSLIEVIFHVVILLAGLEYARYQSPSWRRKAIFVYGLVLILYTTLIRRIPNVLGRTPYAARLEFVGFNPVGFILNVLLFLPLGISLRLKHCWLVLCVSVIVEVTQQITHIGMLDVWDIVANTIGGLAGCFGARGIQEIWKKKLKRKVKYE